MGVLVVKGEAPDFLTAEQKIETEIKLLCAGFALERKALIARN
jgi:hypothetical protein